MTVTAIEMARKTYSGKRVTVMGLGSFGGGVAVTKFLAAVGAEVSVTDLKPEAELADSLAALESTPVTRFAFGGHPEELCTTCDVLIVNPAVPADNSLVLAADSCGVRVTSEIGIFCQLNPALVIGVTGTNGKSTTTALIHHLLLTSDARDGKSSRNIWLGGNIGVSLLPVLEEIRREDIVVLELSSFQLEALRAERFSPQVAVITNLSPNHLDWHKTFAAYQSAKQVILDFQRPEAAAVLPDDDDHTWRTRGGVWRFGTRDTGEDGAFLEDGLLILRSGRAFHLQRDDGKLPAESRQQARTPGQRQSDDQRQPDDQVEEAIRMPTPTGLPGHHNRQNIAAAAGAAWLCGANPAAIVAGVCSFRGLPHRLQCVAQGGGLRFVDDSIATTPESAIAALRVFSERVLILAGGYDKQVDLRPLAVEIAHQAAVAVLMGQTAGILKKQINEVPDRTCETVVCGRDFKDSFRQAVALSQPGDIVLLSPGCASYDWFSDFRDRGQQFADLAHQWINRI